MSTRYDDERGYGRYDDRGDYRMGGRYADDYPGGRYEQGGGSRRGRGGGFGRGEYGREGIGGRDFGGGSDYGYGGQSYPGGRSERDDDRGYGFGVGDYGRGLGSFGNDREDSYSTPYGGRYGRGYFGDDERSERGYSRRGSRRGRDERDWWDRTRDEVASWFGDEEAERRRRRDERRGGGHRGRGPRGYKRSDERIREDVSDRLSDHDYLDASDVEVKVEGGEVTLSGTVESRWARRAAEDIAEDVSGVSYVQNNLRVSQGATGSGSSTTGTALTEATGTETTGAGRARAKGV